MGRMKNRDAGSSNFAGMRDRMPFARRIVSSGTAPAAVLLFPIMMAVIAGCGAETEPCSVSGTVTFQGKTIEEGVIQFRSLDGDTPVDGQAEIVNGKYSVSEEEGLVPGKYTVSISAWRKAAKPKRRFETLEGDKGGNVDVEAYIPEKYNLDTQLKCTLKAGKNSGEEFNFKLLEN